MSGLYRIKKILIYTWGSNSERPLLNAIARDTDVIMYEFSHEISDHHADASFSRDFMAFLHKTSPDAVFSYDYFPLIAMICSLNSIPYISWVYDCPQYTLNSLTVSEPYNYIFCFDRIYADRIRCSGGRHVFHQPLAVDVEGWQAVLDPESSEKFDTSGFSGQISFVGSFYSDKKNRIRSAEFDDYTRGYIDGLISSQSDIFGSSFIYDAVDKSVAHKICNACGLSLNGSMYSADEKRLAADAVNMELTSRDRAGSVSLISERYPVNVWTSSLPASLAASDNIIDLGYADYMTQMPFIFRDSAINLNFTSRSIESGIPLRVLDILACGGFCLTYYQDELSSVFVNGRDLAMAESREEFSDLACYYMSHPEERAGIAASGQQRIRECFSLSAQFMNMLEIVTSSL